jgi:hypothetical protein
MLKEHEPKEKARARAARKWNNADVRKRVKQRQEKPKLVDPDAKPELAEVITNKGRRDGRVNRFENKFKRDIKSMMTEQSKVNLQIYAFVLDRRLRVLLKEKLRRLKLAHNIGESIG